MNPKKRKVPVMDSGPGPAIGKPNSEMVSPIPASPVRSKKPLPAWNN